MLSGIRELQERLGYKWLSPGLLVRALTHSSYGNENGTAHNERLEFLGDSAIDLVSAEWIMAEHIDWREGPMSKLRAELVCADALAARARALDLGKVILVGKRGDYLREVDSVLADALEAVIGSAYLDSGGDVHTVRAIMLAAGILHR